MRKILNKVDANVQRLLIYHNNSLAGSSFVFGFVSGFGCWFFFCLPNYYNTCRKKTVKGDLFISFFQCRNAQGKMVYNKNLVLPVLRLFENFELPRS